MTFFLMFLLPKNQLQFTDYLTVKLSNYHLHQKMFKNQKVSKNTYLQKVDEPEDKQKYLSVAKCHKSIH